MKIPSSYDIIGSKEKAVAIIEISEHNANEIAEEIMKKNKNVKTVLMKNSPRKGKYRIMDLKLIKGEKSSEVLHKEYGYRIMIDPKKVYFSQREGTERERISKEVKKDETVMVFFAGAGPMCIAISKNKKAKKIIGIEINPKAIEYFKENTKLNKIKNIEIISGDVSKEYEDFKNKCDRVIMPLPETSSDYLKFAKECMKEKAVCNMYFFSDEKTIKDVKKDIIKIFPESKIKISKVLPYGPGIWKRRADIYV